MMEKNILGKCLTEKDMDLENKSGMILHSMKATGKMIWQMDSEDLTTNQEATLLDYSKWIIPLN